MLKKHVSTLAITVASAFPAIAIAETMIEPVVVTPTRTAISADDSLVPVTVITAEQIEQARATSVADIIAQHTGVDVGQNGIDGGNASIFIRGTESDHALVLVDGVKLNFASISGGGSNLQHIDPANIERIEIIKGPRSTLYGSEAIGGVIHIITKKGNKTNVVLNAETGPNNTNRGSINAAYRDKAFRLFGNASQHTTDGQPVFENDGTGGDNSDRGFARTTYGLGAGWTAGNTDFEISHNESRGDTEYTGVAFPAAYEAREQKFKQQITTFNANFNVSDIWVTKIALGLAEDDLEQKQSTDRIQTRRKSLDIQNDLEAGNSIFTWGIYLENKKEKSIGFATYARGIQTRALYLQNQTTWGKNRALFGVRVNKENESDDSHHTFNAELGRDVGNTILTLGIGTAVRAPTVGELFGYSDSNPNLQPEESTNIEFGLKTKRRNGHVFSASLFRNEIDNLISCTFSFITFTCPLENINQTRIKGLELGWSYVGTNIDAAINYTAQDPRNLDTDQQLVRRSKQILSTRFLWKEDNYQLGFSTISRDKRPDFNGVTFANETTDSYHLLNLQGSYQIDSQWTVSGKIENALKANYELVRSYQTRDRSLFVGLKYQLK